MDLKNRMPLRVACAYCERPFDLTDDDDYEAWFGGHDCEEDPR